MNKMMKKLLKVAMWTAIGATTGMIGLGLIELVRQEDYPLE